jgi:hypothetical protein
VSKTHRREFLIKTASFVDAPLLLSSKQVAAGPAYQLRRAVAVLCSVLVLCSTVICPAQTKDPAADPANTQRLVGAFVSVLGMAAEPEGPIVLAAAQGMQQMMSMLGFFDKPDAIKALSDRIDELNQRVDRLYHKVDELKNDRLRDKNEDNLDKLRQESNRLQLVMNFLKDKGPLGEQANTNALMAEQVCNDLKATDHWWNWSDEAIKDIDPKDANTSDNEVVNRRNADLINQYLQRWHHGEPIRKGDMMDADFKPMPTLQVYTAALIAWMAALDYASGGDTNSVKQNYRAKLQSHIDFLSVRANWSKSDGQPPRTLPEKVISHIRSYYFTLHPTADSNRECDLRQYVDDGFARDVHMVGKLITYAVPSVNEMCGPGKLVDYESGEEKELESSYGLSVMELLVKKLSHVRDQGTIREQLIGTFNTNVKADDFNILYTVSQDGALAWYKHEMRYPNGRNSSAVHTVSPAKIVGQGWGIGVKDVMPMGQLGIYTLKEDGTLTWNWHLGFADGSYQWRDPLDIAKGLSGFSQIVAQDEGVLYGRIEGDPGIFWGITKNYDSKKGPPSAAIGFRLTSETINFAAFKTVFAGGKGVLYAIDNAGNLLWMRHIPYLSPIPDPAIKIPGNVQYEQWRKQWIGPVVIATGLTNVTRAFSSGEGHIYYVNENGALVWRRHTGWEVGTNKWQDVNWDVVANGWRIYKFIFARNTTSDLGSGNPQVDIIVH